MDETQALSRLVWLTVDEAAEYLRVSRRQIYRFCSEGVLPYYTLPGVGARRFRREDLDALLHKRQGKESRT